jgi:CRP-like cAMP-binding protein
LRIVPSADTSDLAAVPLLASLSETELAEVAGWFEVKDVRAGVRLVGEGTTGHSFFLIQDGEVSVSADGAEVATLGSGDFFGELALLEGGRRTATVTTTAPTRVLVLFGNDLARLRTRHPGVAAEIDAAMRERLKRS